MGQGDSALILRRKRRRVPVNLNRHGQPVRQFLSQNRRTDRNATAFNYKPGAQVARGYLVEAVTHL